MNDLKFLIAAAAVVLLWLLVPPLGIIIVGILAIKGIAGELHG